MVHFLCILPVSSFESPRSSFPPFRAVGHWTNSLYQYFEREQARLEGLPDPHKKSKIVETLAAARDRARKMSASVTGATAREPAHFHLSAAAGGGSGGPGGMAVWGGGGGVRRASHSTAAAAAAVAASSVGGGVRRASAAAGGAPHRNSNNNNNYNTVVIPRQMKRMDTSTHM
jgi:hypothetical protein